MKKCLKLENAYCNIKGTNQGSDHIHVRTLPMLICINVDSHLPILTPLSEKRAKKKIVFKKEKVMETEKASPLVSQPSRLTKPTRVSHLVMS